MKGEVQLEQSSGENPSDSDPLLENQENSNEIEDEEMDAGSAACCRICLECDGEPGYNAYSATECQFFVISDGIFLILFVLVCR